VGIASLFLTILRARQLPSMVAQLEDLDGEVGMVVGYPSQFPPQQVEGVFQSLGPKIPNPLPSSVSGEALFPERSGDWKWDSAGNPSTTGVCVASSDYAACASASDEYAILAVQANLK
jgi:hypothetical protein